LLPNGEDGNDMDDKQEKANKLANEVRARREKEQLDKKTHLYEDQRKREQAPLLWSETKTLIKEKLEALAIALGENDFYKWESLNPDEVVIRLKAHVMNPFGASFDPSRLRLDLRFISTGAAYETKISGDQVFFAERGSFPRSPEEIAESMLREISKWV
jgi:hypothetical protein